MDITFNKMDFYDRISNYKKIIKSFKKFNRNQCLISVKQKQKDFYEYFFDKGTIILKKRIGSNSRYGIVYLASNEFSTVPLAVKLTPENSYNLTEVIIAKKLSSITVKDLNPHFLIVYNYFLCTTTNEKEAINLPSLIKYVNYFISINELADGNLKYFLIEINDPEMILNAYQQILIAVLSFHYYSGGLYHRDCHYKNFLCHKIKPGGYFHYKIFGKDIYIENKGFIWLIWDFGLIKDTESNKEERLNDYFRVNSFFKISRSYYDSRKFTAVNKFVTKLSSIMFLYKELYGYSDKKFFTDVLFKFGDLFETSYKPTSFIINKKAYTINNFSF